MRWFNTKYKQNDTKDRTASFAQAEKRENIKTGEKHSIIFGKIAKWFAELKEVAFSGSYNDLKDKPQSFSPSSHSHTKSEITDFPSIPAAVRVKGNAENSYRTGDVNLTPANIGAAASSHSHSEYAAASHSHSEYAASNHEHSDYALKSKYGDTTINVGRKTNTTVGSNSTAEGNETTASNGASHAEGDNTKASGYASHAEGGHVEASGNQSHAEGNDTIASGNYSHAEGYWTKASGVTSHAEGNNTIASGYLSHTEGDSTEASGSRSHAEGNGTKALDCQHVQGHYNNTSLAPAASNSGTSGTLFVIGNGTSDALRSNAFRVTGAGVTYAKGNYNTTGADYAEYFEWLDGNTDNEDRTGIFVTIDGDKIKPADEGSYILGIISANPSVIGNSDEHWMGQFKKDIFNRYVIEEQTEIVKEIKPEFLLDEDGNPVLDEDGNPIITEKEVEKEITFSAYVENEGYDKDKGYIQRCDRPEWDAVGLLGQLVCYDDGTCQVNGYCKCGKNGIGTAATFDEGSFKTPVYRVMERVSDNLVRVLLK